MGLGGLGGRQRASENRPPSLVPVWGFKVSLVRGGRGREAAWKRRGPVCPWQLPNIGASLGFSHPGPASLLPH